MGKNKDWATERLTADYDPDVWSLDNEWPTYTATHSEMFTVGPFDHATPDMFAIQEYTELKKKYPALQQAWDHYQVVLKMCRAKEAESEN